MGMIEDKLYPGQKVEDLDLPWLADKRPSVFDMFADAETMANPYPLYRRLLTERPVHEIGGPIAFTRFAEAYARQNDRDYAALRDAVASGRVAAEPDL